MPNDKYFLVMDTHKNIMLIPDTCLEIHMAIRKTGIESVMKNETVGEVVAKVKRYLRGESVTEDVSGESDGTT